MASYCSIADVQALLPSDSTVTEDAITGYITRASSYVQGGLEPNYWPLPDYNATVATPEAARQAAAFYACYLALWEAGQDNLLSEDGTPARLLAQCDAILEQYNGPGMHRQLPQVSVTGEELSFGIGTASDETDLAFLAYTQVEVIPESLEMDDYENGIDFSVYWSQKHRRWVLQRMNSAITDGDTVNYRFSYLKTKERTTVPSRFGGELFLA